LKGKTVHKISYERLLLVRFRCLNDKHYMIKKKRQTGVLIISTFPSEESITGISEGLIVSKKLCACITLTKVRSIYYWNKKLEDQEEFIVFFKTTKLCAKRLKDEIKKLHPYDVPEILELKIDDISRDYLSWLVQSTTMSTAARSDK
jgi:periplasmic divalent cation tolerance protein